MLARALLIVAVVSSAVLAVSANARVERSTAGPWSGTVRVVDDADHTFAGHDANGNSLTVFLTYHDEAVYTLTGETTPDGLWVAQMTGSGKGRVTGTSPVACVLTYDPYLEWSYSGQVLVSVSYSGGRYVVQPQSVTVDYHSLRTGCGTSDLPLTNQLPAPYGIGVVKPQGVAAAETATTLTGSETFPLPFTLALITENAGTTTLTWDLQRTGGTPPPPSTGPPTGTASGTVLVNGKPYTSGQPIPYGSKVGVTHGRLTLKTDLGALTVYGAGVSAIFRLLRFSEKGKPLVELRLVSGDFSVCKRAFRTTSAAKPPKKTVRRLFAKGKGNFRTRGHFSAAAVRGTSWLTADRCDGTLTQVQQGKVEVNDFVKHKRVLVRAGKSYLAKPKR